MSQLTDAEKKSFSNEVTATLKGNKDLLIASQWDPTQRIAALEAGASKVQDDESDISKREQELITANATHRADLETNYQLASSTIGAVESALGKTHPIVHKLHQLRGGMSHASPTPQPANP